MTSSEVADAVDDAMVLLINSPDAERRRTSLEAARMGYGPAAAEKVRAALSLCPAYRPTPLVERPEFALALAVGAVWIKDERERLGLGSFKALGGSLAVLELATEDACRQAGRAVTLQELIQHRPPDIRPLTFTAATAGNHGRAVAAGAALVGADCVIFVYDDVPEDQIAAIERHGATIVRAPGIYDDALAACRARAEAEGWTLISDTAWTGHEDTPARVQRGYAVIAAEVAEQAPEPPTHIFIQAGVGGVASALTAYAAQVWTPPPAAIVVEPETAACVLATARAGRMAEIASGGRTNMGRLACYAPSLIAWRLLDGLAFAFQTISDHQALAAAEAARAAGLPTSPSGAAGLAGLQAAAADPGARARLGLDAASRVLLVLTEQATTADRGPGRPARADRPC